MKCKFVYITDIRHEVVWKLGCGLGAYIVENDSDNWRYATPEEVKNWKNKHSL